MRLALPWIDERELEEVASVLSSGFLSQGRKVEEFEQLVSEFVGSRHAVATSSATTALHLSLVALGVGPGDEVIVPDFTFPATANVVVQQGAVPVLVDIELDTFSMDVEDCRAKLSERTKAIMVVDAFGCAANLGPIVKLASERGVPLVEDAACAIGATYDGRFCGTLGRVGCFSFHPRKVITTGEGGMIVTDDDALAQRLRVLVRHGASSSGGWDRFEAAGFNYRLSDVHGALGVAQMEKLPLILSRRREVARALKQRLRDLPGPRPPVDPPWGGHTYQSFIVLLDEALDRDAVIAKLAAAEIETTLGTYALHAQPFFRELFQYTPGQLPRSYAAFRRSLALPFYPQMSDHDLDRLVDELSRWIR